MDKKYVITPDNSEIGITKVVPALGTYKKDTHIFTANVAGTYRVSWKNGVVTFELKKDESVDIITGKRV